jgi:hypothetical protein
MYERLVGSHKGRYIQVVSFILDQLTITFFSFFRYMYNEANENHNGAHLLKDLNSQVVDFAAIVDLHLHS